MLLLKNNHHSPAGANRTEPPWSCHSEGWRWQHRTAPGCAGRGPRQLSTSASSEGCADEP